MTLLPSVFRWISHFVILVLEVNTLLQVYHSLLTSRIQNIKNKYHSNVSSYKSILPLSPNLRVINLIKNKNLKYARLKPKFNYLCSEHCDEEWIGTMCVLVI